MEAGTRGHTHTHTQLQGRSTKPTSGPNRYYPIPRQARPSVPHAPTPLLAALLYIAPNPSGQRPHLQAASTSRRHLRLLRFLRYLFFEAPSLICAVAGSM